MQFEQTNDFVDAILIMFSSKCRQTLKIMSHLLCFFMFFQIFLEPAVHPQACHDDETRVDFAELFLQAG